MTAHIPGPWLVTATENQRRRRDGVVMYPERWEPGCTEVDAALAKPSYRLSIPAVVQKPPPVVNQMSYQKLGRLWGMTGPAAYKRVQKYGYERALEMGPTNKSKKRAGE